MRILMAGPDNAIAMQRPLKWLLARGHQVWQVGYDSPYDFGTATNYHYVPFGIMKERFYSFSLPFLKTVQNKTGWHFENSRLSAWISVLQLRVLVAILRPDVIHYHSLEEEIALYIQANLHPLVVSAWGYLNHLVIPDADQTTPPPYVDSVLQSADALIVESPQLLQKCRSLVNHAHLALIPLGVNTELFQPGYHAQRNRWRRFLGISEETIVILSPRQFCSEEYGHHHILAAYAQVSTQFCQPTILAFIDYFDLNPSFVPQKQTVGLLHNDCHSISSTLKKKIRSDHDNSVKEGSFYAQRIHQEATKLGMAEKIRWLPALRYEMMPILYALADVIVNYPSTDAFPSTLIEAVACQRPVITTCLPSYQGTFIEEFCTLVPPEQPAALAKALLEVVNNHNTNLHTTRLRQARQCIMDGYNDANAAEQLLALYDQVVSHS